MKEHKQIAILVGVHTQLAEHFNERMDELKRLAQACNVEVAAELTQKMTAINQRTYVGAGKLAEIKVLLEQSEANMVIVNGELSPSQLRRMEEELTCKIVDRTMLILEIFETRAHTREAILQVKIAKLRYFLPRLVGLRSSLGRQSGGVGTQNKGTGEKKLELDRRRIEEQIVLLKRELKEITVHRQTQRQWRQKQGVPVVALVGYTNAGKSTILNAILQSYVPEDKRKEVYAQDMLFATLQTASRSVQVAKYPPFLLTDTVGFIADLPHHLVDAFKSTLEEIKEADLLLHVIDVSDESYSEQQRVSLETIERLGAAHIPVLTVYNKVDACLQLPVNCDQNAVYLSAKRQADIHHLVGQLVERLFPSYLTYQLKIPYTQAGTVAQAFQELDVITVQYHESEVALTARLTANQVTSYQTAGVVLVLLPDEIQEDNE